MRTRLTVAAPTGSLRRPGDRRRGPVTALETEPTTNSTGAAQRLWFDDLSDDRVFLAVGYRQHGCAWRPPVVVDRGQRDPRVAHPRPAKPDLTRPSRREEAATKPGWMGRASSGPGCWP